MAKTQDKKEKRETLMSETPLNQNFPTYNEIVGQPSAWEATLNEVQAKAPAVRELITKSGIERVVFTGCGTPYYLSLTAAVLCREATGLVAEAHPASSIWLYPEVTLGKNLSKTLLVVTSRSGETTEVLQAIQQFRINGGGPVVAITCYDDSSIVSASTLSIFAQDCREVGLAQTRSFTSMMIAAQSLIMAIAGKPLSKRYLELPSMGRSLLDTYFRLARELGEDKSIDRFFFLGSHPYYGLACEAMLKMKEMTLSYSEAFHFMEFRHGPMALINSRSLVVGLMTEKAMPHEIAVLAEMQSRGARTLAVTPVPLERAVASHQIVLPGGLTDLERVPLYMPVLHVLDYCRTLLNGLNPDKPHSLNAVVNLDINAIENRGQQDS